MNKAIIGFHKDQHEDWVAELDCGHYQHTRHNPPWINRPWVESETGRQRALGQKLNCKKCETGELRDDL